MQTKTSIFTAIIVGAVLLAGAVGMSSLMSQAANAPQKVDVLIGFTNTPGPSEQALVRNHGGVIKHSYHLVPAIAASVPESAISGLLRNPHITGVDLDGTVYAIDAELDNTWGVKRIGSGTVHDAGNKGTGVKVAVIDSGIDYTHPDLGANYAGGYNFVGGNTNPMDDNGHGTHVAGTIAALKNSVGVVGVAPEARLYALKVLNSSGSGSWSDVIAALQWAVDNKIQVTNNSYGSGQNPGGIVQAAFDNSAALGILHIAAAGNSGNPKGRGNNVGYPAAYASVVAVAATDKNDNRASFSSTGDKVELAAPGVTINSTKLGGGYIEYSGTSMASPHVAGSAALVIAAGITDKNGDGFINDEVRAALDATALDLGAAGRDPLYGFGLVNVAAAVASVVSVTPPPPPVVGSSVVVSDITYVTEGGRNNDKHLNIAVSLVDNLGNAVIGASVSINLLFNGSVIGSGSGTTGTNGIAVFTLKNAPSGHYETKVTGVGAAGLAWDGITPVNGFDK